MIGYLQEFKGHCGKLRADYSTGTKGKKESVQGKKNNRTNFKTHLGNARTQRKQKDCVLCISVPYCALMRSGGCTFVAAERLWFAFAAGQLLGFFIQFGQQERQLLLA